MNRRKVFWFVISILIAVLSIWTVTSQSASFSFSELYDDILNADKLWFFLGILCMFGFIYFEGKSICVILKELLHKRPRRHGLIYATSDIFFSAITPSATGGQPASAYFMMRDGISASVAMLALLINLVMYNFALMITGTISIIAYSDLFEEYSAFAQVLIVVGFVILIICIIGFIMLVLKENLLYRIVNYLFNLMVKVHLIRNVERRREKIDFLMEEYRSCAEMLLVHKRMLVNAFFLNLLQRLCQICVALCMFIATGGAIECALEVGAVQNLALLGSNVIPVPGAMGVIDYLLLEGFSHIPEIDSVANMELLVRGVSFYICVCLCGIFTLVGYLLKGKTAKDG